MMHISFFIGDMVSGGAERVIQLLANDFVQSGWKVDIVMLLSGNVNYEQFPLSKEISIIDLSGSEASYHKNAFRWLTSIRKYVKQTKPDCIVSFIGRINALVLTSTLGLKLPILVSERNDPRHDGRSKAMLKYCNLIYKKASSIVFQTQYEQHCFDRRLYKKSYVIPNPVSVSSVCDVSENPKEISTAGRLVPQKNHAMLIEAINLVKQEQPDVQCEIYGEGELRGDLEQKVKSLKLEQNVHLPGNKTDIHRWIAKSSIFVMSSEFEGQSNALIEAMMLGKACITTDYPGADEVITDGIDGIIVPRDDSWKLSQAIIQLLMDQERRDKMAKNAKESAYKYRSEHVVESWKSVITTTCSPLTARKRK